MVNWNGWSDTIECLESLFRLADKNFHITVCDNGSKNRSLEHIVSFLEGKTDIQGRNEEVWSKLEFASDHSRSYRIISPSDDASCDSPPLVTLVKGAQNVGFAAGCNVGIRLALKDPDCEYVWLVNNDTVVDPNALSALQDLMEKEPEVAVCGSTLLYYGSPDTVQGLGGHFSLIKASGFHIGASRGVADLPSRAEVEMNLSYVIGASMLVRRAVFERTGGLSEDYFLYYEELDLARSLSKTERLAWAPESVVYHKVAQSFGPQSMKRPSDTSLYYRFVNVLRVYRKFHFWMLPIAFARIALEATKAATKRDWAAVRIAGRAAADFVFNVRHTGAVKLGR